mgnify:CR=1 FL=1
MKPISLYFHIPFCKQKCKYCAFVSFTSKEKFFKSYISSIKKELDFYKKLLKNYEVRTIYFGGGTPSLLEADMIPKLLEFVKNNFSIYKNTEITVEANPESFNLKKARMWKKAGVNRLSIGLQSDDDLVLKKLGRIHNYKKFLNAFNIAKKVGFSNINVDIIFGLENQTEKNVKELISKLADLGVTHISAYGLQLEENTRLKQEVESGQVVLPSEERCVKIYNTACKELKKLGFIRYEISNFAKKGYESKHNLNYWARGEYLGIGVGAYSFSNGEHWENTSSLDEYLSGYQRKNVEVETTKTAMEEMIMLALRTEKGLDINLFNSTFGNDFEILFKKQIEKLKAKKLIKIVKNHIKITNFEVSNQIIAEFF